MQAVPLAIRIVAGTKTSTIVDSVGNLVEVVPSYCDRIGALDVLARYALGTCRGSAAARTAMLPPWCAEWHHGGERQPGADRMNGSVTIFPRGSRRDLIARQWMIAALCAPHSVASFGTEFGASATDLRVRVTRTGWPARRPRPRGPCCDFLVRVTDPGTNRTATPHPSAAPLSRKAARPWSVSGDLIPA